MKKCLLPTTRRNQVLEEIEKHELAAADFEWAEVQKERIPMVADEGVVSVLVHRPTGYSFSFDLRGDQPSTTFSPGQELLDRHEICRNIPQIMGFFVLEWLPSLKREVAAPDLWAELQQTGKLVDIVREMSGDGEFSETERAQATEAIRVVKQWLLEHHEFDREQAARINARFDYLIEAVRRMSRMDWLHTAIGVLFTIAVGLAPARARELFDVAANALSGVVGQVKQLLP